MVVLKVSGPESYPVRHVDTSDREGAGGSKYVEVACDTKEAWESVGKKKAAAAAANREELACPCP